MIYDEESDRHVHIPFEQALYATAYGAQDGPTGDLFNLANVMGIEDVKNKFEASLKKPIGTAPTEADTVDKLVDLANAATTAAGCKSLVDALIALVKAGVWVPIEIVIARPFIEHLMLSAIVAVAGRDTGATLFGPADMCDKLEVRARLLVLPSVPSDVSGVCFGRQISANTSVKTIEGAQTAGEEHKGLLLWLQPKRSLLPLCRVCRSLHVRFFEESNKNS